MDPNDVLGASVKKCPECDKFKGDHDASEAVFALACLALEFWKIAA